MDEANAGGQEGFISISAESSLKCWDRSTAVSPLYLAALSPSYVVHYGAFQGF